MNSDSHNSRTTVEDLLRLKRCEKPQAEFWTNFEKQLRTKQLAAIVEKRPWWSGFSRALHWVSRFSIPLGAGAAFFAALAGFHEYRLIARAEAGSAGVADIPSATVVGGTSYGGYADSEDSADRDGSSSHVRAGYARSSTVAYHEAISTGPSSVRPWGIVSRHDGWLDMSDSPSARSIAANLAAIQASHPEIVGNLLRLSQRFDSQLVPERRAVAEPMAQIDANSSEERRSRILADALPAAIEATDVVSPASDRTVSRMISDDRLYDEAASRYRLGGGERPSLSIKF